MSIDGLDVQRLVLRPGDQIVLSPRDGRWLSLEQVKQLKQDAGTWWPGHDVVVLNGVSLSIVSSEGAVA